jgi:hypothetical protein
MRWCGWLALVAIAAWLMPVPPAAAVSFALAEADRQDAMRVGQRSVTVGEFGGEWRATDGAGQTLLVMTPYHRLALAARNAAFKKDVLKPKDVESVLKASQNKLTFWVTLRGAKPDFARFLEPVLVGGPEGVKASFVQNERTALREEDGRYAARCLYVFPAEGVAPRARITLLVRDQDSKEMAKFTVDLSAMR